MKNLNKSSFISCSTIWRRWEG